MKKIAEWIHPTPTLPLPGEGVKFDKDENRLSMLDLIDRKNSGIQGESIFLVYYPQKMERICL